jgi:nicotinate-nucleotide adenylyltransferase
VAVDLALHHGIDPKQAKIAALLHDLTKPWPTFKQKAWLSFCDPAYADQPEPILHQKTAVAYARRVLQVRDPAILHAIGHHVDGSSGHPLSQILYIADKCEPSRGYDASSVLALARLNLRAAAEAVRSAQHDYLSKESHGSSN